MAIYNMYIFDRHCQCIFYTEWSRRRKAQMSEDEEKKLVFGMLHSLKGLCEKLSLSGQANDSIVSYRTSAYKLHYYETPSNLRFVLNTDPNVGSMKEILRQIYSQIYVEYVVRNPLSMLDEKIDNEAFVKALDRYVRSLPVF